MVRDIPFKNGENEEKREPPAPNNLKTQQADSFTCPGLRVSLCGPLCPLGSWPHSRTTPPCVRRERVCSEGFDPPASHRQHHERFGVRFRLSGGRLSVLLQLPCARRLKNSGSLWPLSQGLARPDVCPPCLCVPHSPTPTLGSADIAAGPGVTHSSLRGGGPGRSEALLVPSCAPAQSRPATPCFLSRARSHALHTLVTRPLHTHTHARTHRHRACEHTHTHTHTARVHTRASTLSRRTPRLVPESLTSASGSTWLLPSELSCLFGEDTSP